MATVIDNKEGYKKTKLGWIPEDWEVVKFGKYLDISSGFGFKKNEYSNTGYKLVKIDNIGHGKILWNNIDYIPFEYKSQYSQFLLQEDDILLALNRPITQNKLKIAKIAVSDLPSVLYQRVGKIVFKQDKYHEDFTFHLLTLFIFGFVIKNSVGSDQPFISLTQLRNFKIPLPPLAQQQKIAQILSTWEKTIQDTKTLIQEKQQLKKGLMQKLFSQEWRFLDEKGEVFGDWEVKKLGTIVSTMQSGISRKLSTYDIGYPILRSNNVIENRVNFEDLKFWKLVDDKGVDLKKYILHDGDLLINFINSISQIGKVAYFINSLRRDVIFTTNLLRVKLKKGINTNFILFFFQTRAYKSHIHAITKPAINQASFTTKDLNSLKIPLPPLPEQKKIAHCLSTLDQEIHLLEQQQEQWELQKKGLMQQLLTGKVRVLVA